MKTYARLLVFGLIVVGLFSVLAIPALGHPAQNVDNFSTTQNITQTGIGSTFAYVDDATNIIGGQREVTVTVTAVGASNILNFQTNVGGLGQLSHSQGSGVKGSTTLVYDGTTDGGAAGINPGGLGSVDLESGGDTAFALSLISSDWGGQVTITYYSNNSTSYCSSLTKDIPSGWAATNHPRMILFPYSDFSVGSGCTNPANKNSVGAITVYIDGTADASIDWDLTIDLISTVQLDYGDLPTSKANYILITTGDDAAGHTIGTLRMGSLIDKETNGQQNSGDALGDDQNTSDDEDGVTMLGTKWNAGSTNQVRVSVNGDGCLMAWVDWNNDGDFVDTGERIINNQSVSSGDNDITFNVPNGIPETATYYSRFRLYPRDSGGVCTSTKNFIYQVYNGEVEDHSIGYKPTAVTMTSLTADTSPFDATIPLVGLGVVGIVSALSVFALRRRRN